MCQRTNRRLIIPDRPGLGKTPFVEDHPQNWNKQLEDFICKLGLESYDVLGSVIACQMAVSFVHATKFKPNKLILTSPIVLNTDQDTDYLTEILSPAAKYVKMSSVFAKEIYELWLKSITLNLDVHYPVILEQSIGSAERELFVQQDIPRLLTEVFKEGARNSLEGILHEMVFCMTPLGIDLSSIELPIQAWLGTEDKRITLEGVQKVCSQLPDCKLIVKEGYSEHLYYALFEEIIA